MGSDHAQKKTCTDDHDKTLLEDFKLCDDNNDVHSDNDDDDDDNDDDKDVDNNNVKSERLLQSLVNVKNEVELALTTTTMARRESV